MAPLSKSKQRGRAPSAEPETDAKEAEGPAPINLGDAVALKRTLDDAVVETLQNEGWTLDYSLVDLKLVVGLAA